MTDFRVETKGSSGGVSSLTGTANQVLVNGTSGSSQTGAGTLTTPQDIGTSSTPQFAREGIGIAADATHLLEIGLGSISSDTHSIDITGTWNNGATLFTGIKQNITNTNSSSSSKLIDLQVGSVTAFNVQVNGQINGTGDFNNNGYFLSNSVPNNNGNFQVSSNTASGVGVSLGINSFVNTTSTTPSNGAGGGLFEGSRSGVVGGNSGITYGVKGIATYKSTGTQADAIGVLGLARKTTSATGVITTGYGLFGSVPTQAGGGTITNKCGIGTDGVIGFTSALGTAPDTFLSRNGAGVLDLQYDLSNYLRTTVSSAGAVTFDAVGAGAQVTISDNLLLTTQISTYQNISTTGWGVPAIYGTGRATAQTAANASVATYTVGGSDGSFIISANVLVTTSTVHNFTVICTYTDEGNTSRTLTIPFTNLAGTALTGITNAAGTVPYEGIPQHLRCKASTSITISTTGTFTTVTYNVEGMIAQIA